ncbi:MAG: hypothetical protein Q8N02_02810 [Methylotenera sp.]|nr:hypothetical protein [Methylotenera sp.]MDP2402990.1 hypothetical protein [Methylotenera sp.]MDP3094496.1 hypothetical protein [Methylotenera sp.]MDZ4223530.1 hypothetical protein [Methylotenera sp.]
MNFSDLRNKLPFFKSANTLLVCETDGLSLRGVVVARAAHSLSVLHVAESNLPDLEAAVADLIAQLRALGWKDNNAILLNPAVTQALIELPVDPKAPREESQMHDLVHWEIEPQLMQQSAQWSLGRMLVALGYLTQEQAQAVHDTQQGRGKPAGTTVEVYAYKIFGDIALDLGYITRTQLDESLLRQEWLKGDLEQLSCNWLAQSGPKGEDAAGFHWMASALSRPLQLRWVAAFSRQSVRLQSIYPLLGCSVALLPAHEDAVAMEVSNGASTLIGIRDGLAATVQTHFSETSDPLQACLENYHAIPYSVTSSVWLGYFGKAADELQTRLSSALGVDVHLLPDAHAREYLPQMTAGMLGAAMHTLGVTLNAQCCDIPAAGPRKPLFKRVEVRAGVLIATLLVLVMIAEVVLFVRQMQIGEVYARVTADEKKLNEAVKEVQTAIDGINQQKGQLLAQQNERLRLEARLRFFAEELPDRAVFVQALFAALENTVTESVVIDHIEEFSPQATSPESGFNLTAWALSDEAAVRFVKSLKEAMLPWKIDVENVNLTEQQGRLKLNGYLVRLRLVKKAQGSALNSLKAGATGKDGSAQ